MRLTMVNSATIQDGSAAEAPVLGAWLLWAKGRRAGETAQREDARAQQPGRADAEGGDGSLPRPAPLVCSGSCTSGMTRTHPENQRGRLGLVT